MATASQTPRSAQSYNHHGQYRHHPYAPPAASTSSASASASSSRPKWQSTKEQQRHEARVEPPSPPRSHRDSSATPPLGLGVAFGGASGGKWWDEELPAPPSSLSSILDSFRRSGEGDRELLLSILGAKKAEEERLTALIQTRLTILQARLSVHSAAAQMSYSPLTPPTESRQSKELPILPERTPSLGGSSRGSASSNGPVSPNTTYMAPPPMPAQLASEKANRGSYFTLPPPQSMLRHRSRSRSPLPHHREHMPALRIGDREVKDSRPYHPRGSISPRSTGSEGRAPGLDMLLDVGMERERRDSAERQ